MYKSPITFAALLALPGCICTIPQIEQNPSIGLSRFNSCEAMNYHLTDSLTRNFAGYGRWVENDIALEAGAVEDTSSGDSPSGTHTDASSRTPSFITICTSRSTKAAPSSSS